MCAKELFLCVLAGVRCILLTEENFFSVRSFVSDIPLDYSLCPVSPNENRVFCLIALRSSAVPALQILMKFMNGILRSLLVSIRRFSKAFTGLRNKLFSIIFVAA